MAAADSLQLLLLVTLAKLGTRVKFCSCRQVLEGFGEGGDERVDVEGEEERSRFAGDNRRQRGEEVSGREGRSERARTSLGLHR